MIFWRAAAGQNDKKTPLILLLAGLLTLGLFSLGTAPARAAASLDPWLEERLSSQGAGEMTPVIVILKDQPGGGTTGQPSLPSGMPPPGGAAAEQVIRRLQARAGAAQEEIRPYLETERLSGRIGKVTYFWIVNGFSLQASGAAIRALAARPEVAHIFFDESFPAPLSAQAGPLAWDNLARINAPQLWAMGFRGQGVVVASLDSGVDYTHPELSAQWRGGNNSWYDPYGSHPTPSDLPASCGAASGHGTGTVGVMVGKTVGVAPDAQWIAVKIFDDNCQASTSAITQGLQWVLDPDGDPHTPDAPQVVNNSWGALGCGLEGSGQYVFQPALQNLRAAGILPVFSAGNYGPAAGSVAYPANYPEALAVGATDSLDIIYNRSSRGPNNCLVPPSAYPALSAPGVAIYTAKPGNNYQVLSGTSFAAPHAAGTLALLISALPQGLPLETQEAALLNSAFDLGAAGPDNDYGAGRLDAWAAYQWAASHPYPVQISWAPGPVRVAESGGSFSVTLSLNQAAPQTVQVYLSGGTGQLNLPGPVIFNPGVTEQTVQIGVVDNLLPEADKIIPMRLVTPLNAVLGDPGQSLVVTILDDDIQVGFGAAAQQVSEAAGTALVWITRAGGLSFPAGVDCAGAGGTAAAGTDYLLANGTVTFAAGETQKTFPVTLLADGLPGPDKTLALLLSNPIPGAAQLAPAGMTLTILDSGPWRLLLPLVGK